MIARLARIAVLGAMVSALGAAGFAGVASAGGEVESGVAPLFVTKTVSGSVPVGATFTATIQCDGDIINTDDGETDVATIDFGADGQPTGSDMVTFSGGGSCTVTETVDGGASSTTYSCISEVTEPEEPEEEPVTPGAIIEPDGPICASDGPQADPITVNIENKLQVATVTIHNTFDDPKAAAGVVAAPAFTG